MKTVDASSLIDLFTFPENFSAQQEVLKERLIAPAILVPEFLNGIRKMVIRKSISSKLADEAVQRFAYLRIELTTLSSHRAELWRMLPNFTPYDATYVFLANKTRTPLLTSDARLARAAIRTTEVILLDKPI